MMIEAEGERRRREREGVQEKGIEEVTKKI